MARHRNIRKMDFHEERDYGEVYGRSYEDDMVVSPDTEAQFLYQREARAGPSLMTYMQQRQAPAVMTTSASGGNGAETVLRSQSDSATQGALPTRLSNLSIASTSSSSLLTSRVRQGCCDPPPVRITSSSSTPRLGFVTPGSRSPSIPSSPARSPSPSGRATPPTSTTPHVTPVRQLPQRQMSRGKHLVDVVAEYKKRVESDRPQVNLVVIGHVDAGKSTLMGHLLFLKGQVSKKTLHKYEVESQKIGKASFMFAWVLDETGEERNRGITMDVAQYQFDTPSLKIQLLDAPGHRDFIPNMITGAAQADVAVLVVDASTGGFEAGFELGGQTREHAILVRSLGVTQLTVAVNKMDMVQWSETRFNDIVTKLRGFLKQAGFKESDISYLPCSGLTGDNLISSSSSPLASWYQGPTLEQFIDKYRPPVRPVDKPLRLCVADIFKGHGSTVNVSGRVEAGHVQNGSTVVILPVNEMASVKTISGVDCSCSWAVAGEQVVVSLIGIDPTKLTMGSVLCDPESPAPVTIRFRARVIVFNISIPITVGYPVLFHHQSTHEPAVITKLISQLHRSTGEVIKKKPRCLVRNSSAIVEVEVSRPVCVELYQDSKEIGRFMLRHGGATIAAGVITKIL